VRAEDIFMSFSPLTGSRKIKRQSRFRECDAGPDAKKLRQPFPPHR
jgi:hypothetical protein